ncbi:hypothetical protein F5Y11DRAFT_363467 [Daldinia sp. FL1419]|nr:hypothetical protein F5Y11DRAFT_363467 [Daldinia sp. FL1419]
MCAISPCSSRDTIFQAQLSYRRHIKAIRDHNLEKIDGWISQGELTRDRVMSRLNKVAIECAISSEDKQALRDTFASVCSHHSSGGATVLTESAFVSLLQSKAGLPLNSEGAEVGKIIYEMLVYLSTLPFPTQPHPRLEGLALDEITRALAWALSDRTKYIFDESNHSRTRTRSDHKRVLFQSLASGVVPTTKQDEVRRLVSSLARRNLFDVDEFHHNLCGMNNDADGDEIYHDLLEFRAAAKQLKEDEKLPGLHTLSIPPVTPEESTVELSQYDDDSDGTCDLDTGISGVITWPSFCQALNTSTPFLFDPFYRLLTLALLNKPGTFDIADSSEPIPHIPAGAVLTRSRASQLNTFLVHSAYSPDLRRMECYVPSNLPTPENLAQAIQDVPDEAIVLFAGRVAGIGPARGLPPCVFGLFSPKPKEDRSCILARAEFRPNAEGQQQCTLFQLAPRQDLFQGVPATTGWNVVTDADGSRNVLLGRANDIENIEGEAEGAALVLRDGLRRGEFRHRGRSKGRNVDLDTEDRPEKVTYKSNPTRGNWALEFNVEHIEIWSEIDSSESDIYI